MALTGRQVEFAQDGDLMVGKVVDTVVNPNSGLMAQRERVAVGVPTRDGGMAVLVGERVKAAVRMVSIKGYW